MRRISALLGILLVCILALAPAAHAFDCDAIVADDTGKLSSSGISAIEAAASRLANHGPNVRVRLISDFGRIGDLDSLIAKEAVPSCRSWQDMHGGMRTNLIVIAVEIRHRKVGIYVGDLWASALTRNAQMERIKGKVIGPRLKDGDFAGAFSAGLDEIAKVIDAYQSAPISSSGPTTVINQAASDNSGFVSLLGWIFGVLVLLGILFAALRIFSSRKKSEEKRRTVQQQAQVAKTTCATSLNAFNLTLLQAKLNKLGTISRAKDVEPLRGRLTAIQRTQTEISAAYAQQSRIAANDPSANNLAVSQYENIAETFGALNARVATLHTQIHDLDQDADAALREAAEAPRKVADAATAVDNARTSIEKVQGEGFKTDAVANTLGNATKLLADANASLESGQTGAATKFAKEASDVAAEAVEAANGLRTTRDITVKSIGELRAQVSSAAQQVPAVKEAFDDISANFAEVLWANVKGNGTEAQRRIANASKALDDANAAASMDVQDWERAKELTVAANTALRETDALFRSITSLRESLYAAKQKAMPQIEAALAEVNEARSYIKKYADDIEDTQENTLLKDLDRTQEKLGELKAALAQQKPNYLSVVKEAIAAAKKADAVLDTAQKEHEKVERLRKRCADVRDEAIRSIKVARDYIKVHNSDVESDAKNELQTAKEKLESANAATEVADKLRYFEQADQYADSALAKAKRDVEEEERRIRARNSDNDFTTGVIVGSVLNRPSWGSPSSDSGGIFGSGSSSPGIDWSSSGSSGGITGGSSDWGSSGGITGTSSGW